MKKGKLLVIFCLLMISAMIFVACDGDPSNTNPDTNLNPDNGEVTEVQDLKYFYQKNINSILQDSTLTEEEKQKLSNVVVFTKEELLANEDAIDANSKEIYNLLKGFSHDVQSVWSKKTLATTQARSNDEKLGTTTKYIFAPQMLQSKHAIELKEYFSNISQTKNYDSYLTGEMFFLNIDLNLFKIVEKINTTDDGLLLDKENKILFSSKTATGKVVVPSTIERIQKGAFSNNKNITSIIIPDTVKIIQAGAITGCDNAKITVKTEGTSVPEGWDSNFTDKKDDITYEPINPDVHVHNYGEWVIDTNPTCTENGSKHRTCTECGETETVAIEKLGHDWDTEFTIDKAPTCTEEGSKSHHCSRCNEKKDITVIPKLDHTAAKAVKENVVAATCSTPGSYDEVVYCSVCHTEISRVKKTIPVIEHTYGEWVQIAVPTANKPGKFKKVCSECGDEVIIEKALPENCTKSIQYGYYTGNTYQIKLDEQVFEYMVFVADPQKIVKPNDEMKDWLTVTNPSSQPGLQYRLNSQFNYIEIKNTPATSDSELKVLCNPKDEDTIVINSIIDSINNANSLRIRSDIISANNNSDGSTLDFHTIIDRTYNKHSIFTYYYSYSQDQKDNITYGGDESVFYEIFTQDNGIITINNGAFSFTGFDPVNGNMTELEEKEYMLGDYNDVKNAMLATNKLKGTIKDRNSRCFDYEVFPNKYTLKIKLDDFYYEDDKSYETDNRTYTSSYIIDISDLDIAEFSTSPAAIYEPTNIPSNPLENPQYEKVPLNKIPGFNEYFIVTDPSINGKLIFANGGQANPYLSHKFFDITKPENTYLIEIINALNNLYAINITANVKINDLNPDANGQENENITSTIKADRNLIIIGDGPNKQILIPSLNGAMVFDSSNNTYYLNPNYKAENGIELLYDPNFQLSQIVDMLNNAIQDASNPFMFTASDFEYYGNNYKNCTFTISESTLTFEYDMTNWHAPLMNYHYTTTLSNINRSFSIGRNKTFFEKGTDTSINGTCNHDFGPVQEFNNNTVGDHLSIQVCNNCTDIKVIKEKGGNSNKTANFYEGECSQDSLTQISTNIANLDFIDVVKTEGSSVFSLFAEPNIFYFEDKNELRYTREWMLRGLQGSLDVSWSNTIPKFQYGIIDKPENININELVYNASFLNMVIPNSKYVGNNTFNGECEIKEIDVNNLLVPYNYSFIFTALKDKLTIEFTGIKGTERSFKIEIFNLNVYKNRYIPEYITMTTGNGQDHVDPDTCQHEWSTTNQFYNLGVGDHIEYQVCQICQSIKFTTTNGSDSANPVKTFLDGNTASQSSLIDFNNLLNAADFFTVNMVDFNGTHKFIYQPNLLFASTEGNNEIWNTWYIKGIEGDFYLESDGTNNSFSMFDPSENLNLRATVINAIHLKEIFSNNPVFNADTQTFKGTGQFDMEGMYMDCDFVVSINPDIVEIKLTEVGKIDSVVSTITISMLNQYSEISLPEMANIIHVGGGTEGNIKLPVIVPGYDTYTIILNNDDTISLEYLPTSEVVKRDSSFLDGTKVEESLQHVLSEMRKAYSFEFQGEYYKDASYNTPLGTDRLTLLPNICWAVDYLSKKDMLVIPTEYETYVFDNNKKTYKITSNNGTASDYAMEYLSIIEIAFKKAVWNANKFTAENVNYQNKYTYTFTNISIGDSEVILQGSVLDNESNDVRYFLYNILNLNDTSLSVHFEDSYTDETPQNPDKPGKQKPFINASGTAMVEVNQFIENPIDIEFVSTIIDSNDANYTTIMNLLENRIYDRTQNLTILNLKLTKDGVDFPMPNAGYEIYLKFDLLYDYGVVMYIDLEKNQVISIDNNILDTKFGRCVYFNNGNLGYFVYAKSPKFLSVDLSSDVLDATQIASKLDIYYGDKLNPFKFVADNGEFRSFGMLSNAYQLEFSINEKWYRNVDDIKFDAVIMYDSNTYFLYNLDNDTLINSSDQKTTLNFGTYILIDKSYFDNIYKSTNDLHQTLTLCKNNFMSSLDNQYDIFKDLIMFKIKHEKYIFETGSYFVSDLNDLQTRFTTDVAFGAGGKHSNGVYAFSINDRGIEYCDHQYDDPNCLKALAYNGFSSISPDGRKSFNFHGYNIQVNGLKHCHDNMYSDDLLPEAKYVELGRVEEFNVLNHPDNKVESIKFNCYRLFYYFTITIDGVDYDICFYEDFTAPEDCPSLQFQAASANPDRYKDEHFGCDQSHNEVFKLIFQNENNALEQYKKQ